MSDLVALRELLRPEVGALKDAGTWPDLPRICERLGLPWRSAESKRLSMLASFDALADEELPAFAERLLVMHPPSASVRNTIQDLLWRRSAGPEIPKKVRREVARALATEELFQDPARFDALLDKLWVLDRDGDAARPPDRGANSGPRHDGHDHGENQGQDTIAVDPVLGEGAHLGPRKK